MRTSSPLYRDVERWPIPVWEMESSIFALGMLSSSRKRRIIGVESDAYMPLNSFAWFVQRCVIHSPSSVAGIVTCIVSTVHDCPILMVCICIAFINIFSYFPTDPYLIASIARFIDGKMSYIFICGWGGISEVKGRKDWVLRWVTPEGGSCLAGHWMNEFLTRSAHLNHFPIINTDKNL